MYGMDDAASWFVVVSLSRRQLYKQRRTQTDRRWRLVAVAVKVRPSVRPSVLDSGPDPMLPYGM